MISKSPLSLRVKVTLPWLLHKFGQLVKKTVTGRGRILLDKKEVRSIHPEERQFPTAGGVLFGRDGFYDGRSSGSSAVRGITGARFLRQLHDALYPRSASC
jgi:hypothetical protein